MTANEIVKHFQPWRDRWRRSAWRPQSQPGEQSISAAKFGGTPWLATDEVWPACGQCARPMPLLLQLDLAQLPDGIRAAAGPGLLQLFYCTECDDASFPCTPSSLTRIVQPAGPGAAQSPPPGSFPARTISGWDMFDDYPHPEDHERLGVSYAYDFGEPMRTTVTCPSLGLAIEIVDDDGVAEAISDAEPGDKLGGWPHWIQGPEYPSCPRCGQLMTYLFQLDSEDNLPFMFGDAGMGHITQCSEHRDVVAFGWACS